MLVARSCAVGALDGLADAGLTLGIAVTGAEGSPVVGDRVGGLVAGVVVVGELERAGLGCRVLGASDVGWGVLGALDGTAVGRVVDGVCVEGRNVTGTELGV